MGKSTEQGVLLDRPYSTFCEWGEQWNELIPHGDYMCPQDECGHILLSVHEQCSSMVGFSQRCPSRLPGKPLSAGGLIFKCPRCGWLFWFHVTLSELKMYAQLCDHWGERKV